jgi:zinc protease
VTADVAEAVAYPSRTLELPNGMRVLLEQAPDFGAAGAVLVVGAGAADDPAGKAGLAHVAEHMIFSATHGGVSFYDWSRNLDGGVNAYTTWDTTTYPAFERTPDLPRLLTFLHGVATEPLAGIDERVFQREWRAVSNERRRGTEEGTPGQAEGWLITATFPATSSYGHPPVGTPDSLAHITFDDVRAFVAARYRPASCTLVVSAPLPLDEQQTLLESITGQKARYLSIKGRVPARAAAPSRARLPRSFETRDAEVATPTLWIGWEVPSNLGVGGDLAPLVADIAESSAFRELGEADRDIATLRTGVIDGVTSSLFFVHVTLKEATHPAQTARTIVAHLQGSLGQLTSVGASAAVMAQLVGTSFIYRQEGLRARTLDSAWSFHHVGDPRYLRSRGDRMTHLKYADAADYIRDFLRDDQAHVLLVRPGRSADAESPSGPPALVAAVAAAPVAGAESPERPPVPPLADKGDGQSLAGLASRDLPNGLRVIVVRRRGSPFHSAVIGFRGGLAQASPPGVVTATSWGRRWSEDSPRLSGVDWKSLVDLDATFDELHATGTDVRPTLRHLHRMLRGFSMFWPPKEFDKRVEVFEREDHAPQVAFNHLMDHAVYGAQPLGTIVTAKQIRKITPADVTRWVHRLRRPSNAALVLVGDLDPEEAFEAAAAELGSWGADAATVAPLDDPRPEDRLPAGADAVVIQDRPGSKQVGVRVMCVLPNATADNYAAQVVFADSLKRALLLQWREEIGASYAVVGGIDVLPGGNSVLDLAADVDQAKLVPVLRHLRRVLAPESSAPGAERLASTRIGTAARFRTDSTTSGALARRILNMWTLRWPIETLDKLPAQARATSADTVTAIAEHCRANSVVGLLGDETRLHAAWSESAH